MFAVAFSMLSEYLKDFSARFFIWEVGSELVSLAMSDY